MADSFEMLFGGGGGYTLAQETMYWWDPDYLNRKGHIFYQMRQCCPFPNCFGICY